MKKKLLAIFTVCLMCLFLAVPALAVGNSDLVVDDAHLLTTEEKEELLNDLTEASDELGLDIVVHTTDGTDGKDIASYADYFMEAGGYGQGDTKSNIGLVIDMDSRDFAITTAGDARYYFTDYGVEEVLNEIKPYLSDGDYMGAFEQYLDVVKSMIAYKDSHGYAWGENTAENTDTNFDAKDDESDSPIMIIRIVLAVIIGFALSFAATKPMINKMKNVKMKASASDYYNRDELRITGQRDTFLYHTVTKVLLRKDDDEHHGGGGGGFSFHTSSGGVSHGGGSSHF